MEFLSLLILFAVSVWVYRDAVSRGYTSGSALLWSIGVFALLIIFLPIYLITRKPRVERTDFSNDSYRSGPMKVGESSTYVDQLLCSQCGSEISSNFTHCPYCGTRLNDEWKKCTNCGKNIGDDWKVCSHCGTLIE